MVVCRHAAIEPALRIEQIAPRQVINCVVQSGVTDETLARNFFAENRSYVRPPSATDWPFRASDFIRNIEEELF